MRCYECGEDAVAICRWCNVGLCRVHLGQSLASRSQPFTMGCHHVMPDAQGRMPGDTADTLTPPSGPGLATARRH
jgi:hypothetical protein